MPDLSEVKRKWQPVGRLWPILAAAGSCRSRAQFTDVTGDYATVLQNGLNEDLGKLVAMRAFYDSSVTVDPDEFDLFTSRILEGHDSKLRVIWCPHVNRDERAEFERRQREGVGRLFHQDLGHDRSVVSVPRARRIFPGPLLDHRLEASGDAWHGP